MGKRLKDLLFTELKTTGKMMCAKGTLMLFLTLFVFFSVIPRQSTTEASLIGNYDIMRCYEVDVTFHYQIDGGLTNSTITNTKVQFSFLFQQVPALLKCSGVLITRKDILSSPPGVKSIFFRIPMIFTASTNVADSQVSTKITACINTLTTTSTKVIVDSYSPRITQNGTNYGKYNLSTISAKRSCCGGNIPPPCCAVGSVNVSSTKCGCLPGFHFVPGSLCQRCPSDTYQDEQGQNSCKQCPGGKQTFGKTGMTSNSSCSDPPLIGNYDVKRCFEVDAIFHYQIPGGLTTNAIRYITEEFYSSISYILYLYLYLYHNPQQCNGVNVTVGNITSSPPGVSHVYFRVPVTYTASNNISDDQVASNVTTCINAVNFTLKGYIDQNAPEIVQNNATYQINQPSSMEKRSCCGGDIPPPCCAVGSNRVSNTKCGCLPGFHFVAGRSCLPCPADTYQDEQGRTSCKTCPVNTETFGKTGMTNHANCTEASLIGNYDIIRCYEVDITFHYQIDGGLTNSTITHTKAQFSSLFGQASELLNLQSNCSDVVFATKDILSSLPGVKSIFFRIPMIFTAKTNVIDSQVLTKITACICTLTRKYKGVVESKTPSIFQNGTRHNKYNVSTISDKRSCCGKNIPPPCCAVGSVKVSSTKCGCAPGFRYAPRFSSFCLRCPSDTYQDEKGQRECKKCPGEKRTFNKTGVSSESHCLDANPLQIHDQVVKFLPENINNETVVANVTVSAVLSTLVRPFVFYIERVTQQRQYGEMSRRKQRKVEVGSQCIEPGPCPQISVDFCFEAGTVRPENYFCIHRFTGRIRVTQNFVFKEGEEFELQMRVKDSDQRGITENTAVIRLISGDPCGNVNAIYDEAVKYCIKNLKSVDGEKRCLSKQCTKAAHDWKELLHNESKVQKKNCSADTHNLANTLREHPRCGSKQLRPLFPAMLLLVTISTSNMAYGGATANRLADLLILILQYM